MTFGEKLRAYRKAKNMTQEKLAELSGICQNTIVNYEKGKTYPQNREVYAVLARILEVDINALKNENDEFTAEAASKYGFKGKKEAEALVEGFSGLMAGGDISEHDKDVVMRKLQEIYWNCKEDNKKKYGSK